MPRIKKKFVVKLVAYVNKKDWWHVPPLDPTAYQKRGKFLTSSFSEAELYGRPLDEPQRVKIENPLIGDQDAVCRILFGKIISVPEPEEQNFLKQRLALDARMKRAAAEQGYDSIATMHPSTFAIFRQTGKTSRRIELNVFNP